MFTVKEHTIQGVSFKEYTYKTSTMQVTISTLGATIKDFRTKDKNGRFGSIVLAYEDEKHWLTNPKMLGATIGPYAGRIYPPHILIGEHTYPLEINPNDKLSIHSGSANLMFHHFTPSLVDENTLLLTSKHSDKEKPYPGETTIKIYYTMREDSVSITMQTEALKDTYTNLTNHTYFNLSGDNTRTIETHTLKIAASHYIILNRLSLPESIEPVKQTPFDFLVPTPLKNALSHLQKTPQKGIDHPFLLDRGHIVLHDELSGRKLTVTTDQEAVVIYTNNFVSNTQLKSTIKDQPFLGICIECQHIPNDIHFINTPKSFHPKNTTHTQTITYHVS